MGQKCFGVARNSGPVCKKTKLEGGEQMIRGRQYLPKDLSNKQGLFSRKSGEAFARRDLQSIMPLGEMRRSLPNL